MIEWRSSTKGYILIFLRFQYYLSFQQAREITPRIQYYMLGVKLEREKILKTALIDGLQWLGKDISNTVLQGFVLGPVLLDIFVSPLVMWMIK